MQGSIQVRVLPRRRGTQNRLQQAQPEVSRGLFWPDRSPGAAGKGKYGISQEETVMKQIKD